MGRYGRGRERESTRESERTREKVKVEFRPHDVNDSGSEFRGQVSCPCLN